MGNNSIMGLHDTERYKKKEKTGTYIVKACVTNDGGCIRQMKHLNPKPPPEKKQPGLATNSILLGWLFTIKDRYRKVGFLQRVIKGLRQLFLTVFWEVRLT